MDDEKEKEQQRERRKQVRQKAADNLNRAVNDPQFRQRLLDDPAAWSGKPLEGPALPVEYQRQRRELLQQVIDRASSDGQFRAQMTENPRKAIWDAGFGPKLEQLRAELPQADVQGYGWAWGYGPPGLTGAWGVYATFGW